jgi:hypothetical protein
LNVIQLSSIIIFVQLENEVKEQSKKDAQKEQTESEAPIINPAVIEGCSLQMGRWIYPFIVCCFLRMSRIVGQAALMMVPVRLLPLKSAY